MGGGVGIIGLLNGSGIDCVELVHQMRGWVCVCFLVMRTTHGLQQIQISAAYAWRRWLYYNWSTHDRRPAVPRGDCGCCRQPVAYLWWTLMRSCPAEIPHSIRCRHASDCSGSPGCAARSARWPLLRREWNTHAHTHTKHTNAHTHTHRIQYGIEIYIFNSFALVQTGIFWHMYISVRVCQDRKRFK